MAWKRKTRQRVEEHNYKDVVEKIKPVASFDPEMKMIVYGRSATGKTTLAATFPKPILIIDVGEKGTDSIRNIKGVDVLRCTAWKDIDDAYWYLKKEGIKKYKTVVVDTVSQAQDLAIKEVLGDNKIKTDKSPGDWGTMSRRMWGKVSTKVKQVMLDFKDLDMNVVLIAHDRKSNLDEEEADDAMIMPEVGPRLMPSVASTLNAAVSIIGNMFIREREREIKIGKKTKKKREVEYCMRIGPHAIYVTKIRKPQDIVPPALIVDPTYDKILEAVEGE